jgi:gliding motility-associated-like protein
MRKILFLLTLFITLTTALRASHVMGGEITWQCQNGNYVFTLVFYRDCNGAEINSINESLRVWNHPTLSSISLPFVSRTDISPTCNPVTGSPQPLDCGNGISGGNGVGAIEKIVYRSAPIAISGVPPAGGWVFTYENFSRSANLTNITNPSNYGITLAAKIYATPGMSTNCDSSPIFLQEPYFVSCAGTPFQYNMNAVDPDLDSLAIGFGIPYNNFPTGIYQPPTNPIPIPFDPSFSYLSPTPGTSLNALNVPATINASNGQLNFTSLNIGNYVVKVLVKSYRNGLLIGEVEREMQIVVTACTDNNTPPVINAPFAGGSFETTINAGSLVTFTLNSVDPELLQDGSPQNNLLTASGAMFGTNFTSTTGCGTIPCATLNTAPIISGVQGSTVNFSWQTSCDHLVGADGNALDFVPYYFVFKVQDDYCQVPKVRYATVTINVANFGVIQAPSIQCIQSDVNENVTIQWSPVADPTGSFVAYQVHSVQGGLLATINSIATTSWTDPAVTQANDYFISLVSGCNGNALRNSDTVSNIFLNLVNPSNGTALLQWNDPVSAAWPSMDDQYYIYREYPTGTWTLIDSVNYGVNAFIDTIDICQAYLSYQVVLNNTPCDFTSNIQGDDLEDMLTPDIPVISSVSIDTATNQMQINWNQNSQSDTYGYVIYTFDANGFLFELDTVWGIGSTNYSYPADLTTGPYSYSVAAFDSCYTPAIPPTFQTSAKADVHTSIFLTHELLICSSEVKLSWTPYVGWGAIDHYEVWGSMQNGPWTQYGTSVNTTLTLSVVDLMDYCFFVKAVSDVGVESFSNKHCLSILAPTLPGNHYFKVAAVNGSQVELRHLTDNSGGVTAISFERMDDSGAFVQVAQIPVSTNLISYTDADVDVTEFSYTYRARIIDSCGRPGGVSNQAQTILLRSEKDDVRLLCYLQWNPYQNWNGPILGYRLYRGIDGIFSSTPLAFLPHDVLTYLDDLNETTFTGKVCYYVEAIEGSNVYNAPELSKSNETCEVFEPIIYVPNAFIVTGINNTFFPVISNFDPTEYHFTILDRWGQTVFRSNTPGEVWDGTVQGTSKPAETATYVYMVELQDGNGTEIIKRGHVSLLR